jgi:hypothetical protein
MASRTDISYSGGVKTANSSNQSNNAQQLAIAELQNLITPVRVTYILLDDSNKSKFSALGEWNGIGTIEYELVNSVGTKGKALPLNPNFKNYPLINEIVYLISLPNQIIGSNETNTSKYYINLVGVWNHPHHNAYPSLANEPAPTQQKNYNQTQAGSAAVVVDENKQILLGKTFKERTNIHPLLPFEGDVIQEGRWGNSIRLGSTVANSPSTISNNWSSVGTNGDPLTIIRNGQPSEEIQPKNVSGSGWIPITENINNDDSSIYLTSTQKIPLEAVSTSYISYKDNVPATPNEYSGKQILLNSGRLVFNSSNDHILLSSAKSINLNSIDSVNVDTTKMVVQANNIYLGNETVATEPLLLGNATVNLLGTLIQTLKQFSEVLKTQSITSNAVPGSPSDIPAFRIYGTVLGTMMDSLDQQLNDITSKRNFTA